LKLKTFTRKFVRALIISCLSIILTSGIVWISNNRLVTSPVKKLENALYDLGYKSRSINPKHTLIGTDNIVVVDIDNASIRELGRVQLWPRLYDAQVIEKVAEGGAIAIGVDMLYTESDSLPDIYKHMMSAAGIPDSSRVIAALSTDQALANSIAKAQNVYLSFFDDSDSTLKVTENHVQSLRTIVTTPDETRRFSKIVYPQTPLPSFLQGARAVGSINMPSDLDGVIRDYQLVQQVGPINDGKIRLVANFPFYMLIDILGINESEISFQGSTMYLMDSFSIPLNKKGAFKINWLGTDEAIRTISFYKVLNDIVPASYFKDKVVFMGASASGLEDLKTTPDKDDRVPGVNIHAVGFLNMINQAYFKEINLVFFLGILLGAMVLLSFVQSNMEPLFGLLFLTAAIVTEILVSILFLFQQLNLLIPLGLLLGSTLFVSILTTTYSYFTEQKQKRQLKYAFGTYVSATVVNKIIEDPKSLMLGGTKKVLSVLFSDIRGFTKYSEKMDPQLVVAILNKYLSSMSEPILNHEGTIDKFIGDAIFAIFGAPLEFSDHADEACEVAIEMIHKLEEVNLWLINNNFGPLKIGIGINTGEMTIGNIGSTKRFDYTAIGDSVNLGSRVEGLTKFFNVNILVTEFSKNYCRSDQFLFRPLPATIVMGKQEAVAIFELVDYKTNREKHEPYFSIWEQAHTAFQKQDFAQALELFNQYGAWKTDDPATTVYVEKCKEYQIYPERFSNSIEMDSK